MEAYRQRVELWSKLPSVVVRALDENPCISDARYRRASSFTSNMQATLLW